MGITNCSEICSTTQFEMENQISGINRTDLNKPNDINYNNNNNNDNKIKKEIIKEKTKYELFQEKFESKLPNFGQYIEKEQFIEKIPEKANFYMTENEFKLPEEIKINENIYEMKPILFKNGNIYEGYWNENIIMDGKGKYYIEDGNLFIEGLWDNGKSIYGRIYYPNNNIYEGYIKNSNCHGKGKLIFETGELYEGDFVAGDIEGYGKYTFSDKTTYEGNFTKGDFKGIGVIKWPFNITYEGEFSGPALNGYGKLFDNNGEKYEGNFKNNFFEGKGKYTFQDGCTYDGDFERGVRNGKGIYEKNNEFSYEGMWANDYPHGFGTFVFGNISIKGIWRNGINAEITIIEGGNDNDFNHDILNFKIPDTNLIPNRLPNLQVSSNIQNFGIANIPSYLNSKDNNE